MLLVPVSPWEGVAVEVDVKVATGGGLVDTSKHVFAFRHPGYLWENLCFSVPRFKTFFEMRNRCFALEICIFTIPLIRFSTLAARIAISKFNLNME